MPEEITVFKKSLRIVLPFWKNKKYEMLNLFCKKIEKEVSSYVNSENFPSESLYTVNYNYETEPVEKLSVFLSVRDTFGKKTVKIITVFIKYGMISRLKID